MSVPVKRKIEPIESLWILGALDPTEQVKNFSIIALYGNIEKFSVMKGGCYYNIHVVPAHQYM